MAQYNVKFWCYAENGTEKFNDDICFRNLPNCNINKIKYLAKKDADISNEVAEFYLSFLKKILKPSYTWKWNYTTYEGQNYVEFNIQVVGGYNRILMLLFLTAFRNIQEYPEILNEFFKFKDEKNINRLFLTFQQLHHDACKNIIKLEKYGNLSGHGLMYWYYNPYKPLSVKNFYKNLTNNNISKIQSFFEKTENDDKELELKPIDKLRKHEGIFA